MLPRLRISAPPAYLVAAHPAGQDRFVFRQGKLGQFLRRFNRPGHRLRCENDQDAVIFRVLGRDFNRLGVACRVRVAEDVDGVIVAPEWRQQSVE